MPDLARPVLERMIHTLAHRGPDGYGFHQNHGVGLAHARLSIIDLATGDQPISNEDGTVWVVFNGEIFNFIELRNDLEARGHVFRTRSDTETIVHAYEEFGDSFVLHLNGQFAFAIWDQRRQRLVLGRDRLGIRPLYYTKDGDRFLFGSEVKALQPVLRGALKLDVRGLAQVFTFWSTVDDQTVFTGIKSLPAGNLLVVERQREYHVPYWNWCDSVHSLPKPP